MKILTIVAFGLIGSFVGVYLAGAIIVSSLVAKAIPEPSVSLSSASFDDVWPLSSGLQGEEHGLQLQPAISVK